MTEKIQLTKKQAMQIHSDCISDDIRTSKEMFLNGLKDCGYIKKSELQQKIEEVEKRWEAYEREGVLFTQLEQLQYDMIHLFKSKYPEEFK